MNQYLWHEESSFFKKMESFEVKKMARKARFSELVSNFQMQVSEYNENPEDKEIVSTLVVINDELACYLDLYCKITDWSFRYDRKFFNRDFFINVLEYNYYEAIQEMFYFTNKLCLDFGFEFNKVHSEARIINEAKNV